MKIIYEWEDGDIVPGAFVAFKHKKEIFKGRICVISVYGENRDFIYVLAPDPGGVCFEYMQFTKQELKNFLNDVQATSNSMKISY